MKPSHAEDGFEDLLELLDLRLFYATSFDRTNYTTRTIVGLRFMRKRNYNDETVT